MNVSHGIARWAAASVCLIALMLSACGSPSDLWRPGARVETVSGRNLSPSALTARERAAAAWTGSEFVVLGGQSGWKEATANSRTGAAYDPDDARWRVLPDSSVDRRAGASAVLSGTQLVVWGGEDDCGESSCPSRSDGAVYSTQTKRWSDLNPVAVYQVCRTRRLSPHAISSTSVPVRRGWEPPRARPSSMAP